MRVIAKALIAAFVVALPFVAARGQVKPTPPIRGLTVDSLSVLDLDSLDIVKGGLPGDLLGKAKRRQLMDTLELNRRRWEQTRPQGYVIRVLAIDHCMIITTRRGVDRFSHERLIVHDTTITARESAPISEVYSQRCGHAWRVEDLFRDLAGAIADRTATVMDGIQYDAAYGFPRHYWIARATDRPVGVLVESFAPVR